MPINCTNSWRGGAPFRCPCRASVVDHCFMPRSFQIPAAVPRPSFGLIARFSKTRQEAERRPRLARVILAARIEESQMPGTISATLLWLFVINLGIAFGAGLYEHRIVVSRWISSSELSGSHWNADTARSADAGRRFWA